LTSFDFVFWNSVNKCVCTVKIRNLAGLKDRVQEVTQHVTSYMLQGVWKEVRYGWGHALPLTVYVWQLPKTR